MLRVKFIFVKIISMYFIITKIKCIEYGKNKTKLEEKKKKLSMSENRNDKRKKNIYHDLSWSVFILSKNI